MGPSIAVVYLARSQSGSSKEFVRFAESYRRFDAGLSHELILVHKGAARRLGTRAAIAGMFEGTPYRSIDRDDNGFDIQSYLAVARELEHDYVCFLNTFSELCADGWLRKLMQPLRDSGEVGMTGATASYESLYTTIGLHAKVIWMCATGHVPYNQRIADEFSTELALHAPGWLSLPQPDPEVTVDLSAPPLVSGFEQHWREMTKFGGPLYGYQPYRPFPNPHLRSNAFVISRRLLNSFGFKLDYSKSDCNRFESGLDGLPTRLARRGLRSVLVGADGQAFEVGRWSESRGFRLGDQSNVLVKDNQVRAYEDSTPQVQVRIARMTWGDYAAIPGTELARDLGFSLARSNLRLTHGISVDTPRSPSPLTISIVIPTRNRQSLLMQALHTVLAQAYPHWECIVFDNASDEPLEHAVAALGDGRIRCIRSDDFLPVTDSWNRAIDAATGHYVMLIGDDDGLSPNFMSSIEFIVRHHDRPDFIYSSLFQFFYPGVAPWEPSGYLINLRYGEFLEARDDLAMLDPGVAMRAVAASLAFKRSFAFNMQAFAFARPFLESLRRDGKIFHSPFPDYYLANVALGLGKLVTTAPKPLVIAGVSRQSFGFTMFNHLEEKGSALLATDLTRDPLYPAIEGQLLPGPLYNSNYLLTMHHVHAALGAFSPSDVSVGRYRRMQILANFFPEGDGSALRRHDANADLIARLNPGEAAWAQSLKDLIDQSVDGSEVAAEKLARVQAEVSMYGRPAVSRELDIGSFADLRQCFDAMAGGRLPQAFA